MNSIRRGERTLFVTGSKVFVLGLFIVFTAISATQNAPILAAIGGIGVFLVARVLFPLERITDFLEWIACGEAGRWLHNWYLSIMPGRTPDDHGRNRGQIDWSRLAVFGVALLLASSLVVAGVGSGVAAASDGTERECTEVVHDGYLTDDRYVGDFTEHSEIESTDRNVYSKLEETDMFVRLEAENPNSYCVDLTVQIHPDIIPPAEVGEITDTDGDVESTWRNTHDFDSDQSYTEITLQLDGESEATFAPNRIRYLGIAWAEENTDTDGILDRLTSPLGNDDLEERTYTLDSGEGSTVTVPLEHNDGQSIDDWHAVYRVGEDDSWRPITTDSDDPVFYQTAEGGESVQFHFDRDNYDDEVEVEFTANPNRYDDMVHHFRSYSVSWSDLFDFDFDILSIAGGAATPSLAEVAQ